MIVSGYEEVTTRNRTIKQYDIPVDNIHPQTVSSFGDEWETFHDFNAKEIESIGDQYFDIVTPSMLNENSHVIDIGCGSGRFIKYLKGRYHKITGIDPSDAILVADQLLGTDPDIELVKTSTDYLPFPDDHFDFGYSLGVLHHIPDTQKALVDCVKKIKPGGYFLIYLYYSLDNRGFLYKSLFFLSNLVRRIISKMPGGLKKFCCDLTAVFFYMPFVLFSRLLKLLGVSKKIRSHIPLHSYENTSFYIIRNDALDRFGTPLELRFSRKQIHSMMQASGLHNIVFSDQPPYWHAVGQKSD